MKSSVLDLTPFTMCVQCIGGLKVYVDKTSV